MMKYLTAIAHRSWMDLTNRILSKGIQVQKQICVAQKQEKENSYICIH